MNMRLLAELMAVTVATIGFALLFGVPVRYYPYCGGIGGVGWLIFRLLIVAGESSATATFVAAMVVILLSRWFAVRGRCPVTIFLISGIIPLVPGTRIYWTAYYIVTDQLNLALETGFLALKAVVAIVLGIVFVFELPQKLFVFPVKKR